MRVSLADRHLILPISPAPRWKAIESIFGQFLSSAPWRAGSVSDRSRRVTRRLVPSPETCCRGRMQQCKAVNPKAP
jgi:hypothetical protein